MMKDERSLENKVRLFFPLSSQDLNQKGIVDTLLEICDRGLYSQKLEDEKAFYSKGCGLSWHGELYIPIRMLDQIPSTSNYLRRAYVHLFLSPPYNYDKNKDDCALITIEYPKDEVLVAERHSPDPRYWVNSVVEYCVWEKDKSIISESEAEFLVAMHVPPSYIKSIFYKGKEYSKREFVKRFGKRRRKKQYEII